MLKKLTPPARLQNEPPKPRVSDAQVQQAKSWDIEDIAARLGIVVLSPGHVWVKCQCPFHGGDSFHLNLNSNQATCFNPSNECLNTFGKPTWEPVSLWMALRKVSFITAIQEITQNMGDSVEPIVKARSKPASLPPKPTSLDDVQEHHTRLMTTPEGERALEYLASRCIRRSTVLRWRIGLTGPYEKSLYGLAQRNPDFQKVLDSWPKASLASHHQRLGDFIAGDPDVLAHIQSLGVNHWSIFGAYSEARNRHAFRLTIPIWEDGPPQEGNGVALGYRYRWVPGLTPELPLYPGATVRGADGKNYLLEDYTDTTAMLRLKRDLTVETVLALPEIKREVTKAWGYGCRRTLAANTRKGKNYALAVEGEMDLLAMDQVTLRTKLHDRLWLISNSNGAGNTPEEWDDPDFFAQFKQAFGGYDDDPAGLQAIQKMRERGLPIVPKPVPVGKDGNGWLIACGGLITESDLQNWLGKHLWY